MNGIVIKPDIKIGDNAWFMCISCRVPEMFLRRMSGRKGKHVAAVLFQMPEFKELELSEVPDDTSYRETAKVEYTCNWERNERCYSL
jgi:hypothetical protein